MIVGCIGHFDQNLLLLNLHLFENDAGWNIDELEHGLARHDVLDDLEESEELVEVLFFDEGAIRLDQGEDLLLQSTGWVAIDLVEINEFPVVTFNKLASLISVKLGLVEHQIFIAFSFVEVANDLLPVPRR